MREKKATQDKADFELILKAYHFQGYAKGASSVHMWPLHKKSSFFICSEPFRLVLDAGYTSKTIGESLHLSTRDALEITEQGIILQAGNQGAHLLVKNDKAINHKTAI